MNEKLGITLTAERRAFLLFYLIPVLVGTFLGVIMATWVFMVFGGGVWTTAVLAGVLSTVWLLIYEEVTYNE